VLLDGLGRQLELGRDLGVGERLADEAQDRLLPVGEDLVERERVAAVGAPRLGEGPGK
jgi:hypothetical protein